MSTPDEIPPESAPPAPPAQPAPDPAAPERARLRPRRAEPWNIGSIVPWGIAATLGDPVLLLVPMLAACAWVTAVLGIGAQAAPEVLVPVWSLPPFGAYQDAGAVSLAIGTPWLVWLARAAFLFSRAVVFGAVAHLALQRASDATPSLRAATRAVREHLGTLLVLELVAWSVFGIPLLLGQGSLLDPGRPVSQLGALVGQVLLINGYLSAFSADGTWRALRGGLAWATRRPTGHLALVIVATALSNGILWVARSGEVGSPRAFPMALYALVHAVVTTMLLGAFTRRWTLLYQAPNRS